MSKKRKGVIVMFEMNDGNKCRKGNKFCVETSKRTYAEIFEDIYEDIKKTAKDENGGHFNIINVIKL